MRINVELPDNLMQMPEPRRVALIALALGAYQTGFLSHHETSTLLEMGRIELDGLLKEQQIMFGAYGIEDLAKDIATLSEP